MPRRREEGDDPLPSFAERPEFADVAPLYLADAVNALPVVQVPYSAEWRETHAVFQALLARGETSPRTHELTSELIALNGADYTAWHWRWRCVQAACASQPGDAPLLDELRFTERYAEEGSKNYQLWNHRRLVAHSLAQRSGAEGRPTTGAREDAFTAAVLSQDAKNYHAWAHRLWAVACFGLQAREVEFTSALLEEDGRNNSAWNARFAALSDGGRIPQAVAVRELRLAAFHLLSDGENEAAWAYARGVARAADMQETLLETARGVLAEEPANVHAASVLADGAEAAAAALAESGDAAGAARAAAECRRMLELCLANDLIRAPYWTFRLTAGAMCD